MPRTSHSSHEDGFVLLEALLALSLIAGLGIAAFEAYQGIALRYHKAQAQRLQLWLAADQHEIEILAKKESNELTRMPRGHRSVPFTRRPTLKGQQ